MLKNVWGIILTSLQLSIHHRQLDISPTENESFVLLASFFTSFAVTTNLKYKQLLLVNVDYI